MPVIILWRTLCSRSPRPHHVRCGRCCAYPLHILSCSASLISTPASARATTLPFRPFSRSQQHVYIKRTGFGASPNEIFVPLCIDGVASVGLLAKRACVEFGLGVPTQARLYLVQHDVGELKPPAEAEADAELLEEPAQLLENAKIRPGSWLLARVLPPAAAASASCGAHMFPPPFLFTAARAHSRLSPPFLRAGVAAGVAVDAGAFKMCPEFF